MGLAEEMAAAGCPVEFVIKAARMEGQLQAMQEAAQRAKDDQRERSRRGMQRLRARRKEEADDQRQKVSDADHVNVHENRPLVLNDPEPSSDRVESRSKPLPKRVPKGTHKGSDATMLRDFDEFWGIYPRRVAKQEGRKAYIAARTGSPVRGKPTREPVSQETILTGAKRYAEECRKRMAMDPASEQYIKHASAWLNGCRWEDYDAQPAAPVETKDDKMARVYEFLLNAYVEERFWRPNEPDPKFRVPHPNSPDCPIPEAILAKYRPRFPKTERTYDEWCDFKMDSTRERLARERASRVAV